MVTRSNSRQLRSGNVYKAEAPLVLKLKKPKPPKRATPADDHLLYLRFLRQLTPPQKMQSLQQLRGCIKANLQQLADLCNAGLLLKLRSDEDLLLTERMRMFSIVYTRLYIHTFSPHCKTFEEEKIGKFWNEGLEHLRKAFLEDDYDKSKMLIAELNMFINKLNITK